MDSAEVAARGIGARLAPGDLGGSMDDGQAESIAAYVHRRYLEPAETVMVWREDAVVVFADDASLIGTQDRQERDRISRVLSDGTSTQETSDSLHVFAPAPVGEDGSARVVAEIVRPIAELAGAGRPWLYGSIAAGLAALLLLAVALRGGGGVGAAPGFANSGPRELRAQRIERQRVERVEQELEEAREAETNVRAELDEVTTTLREVERTVSERDEQTQRLEADLTTVRSELAALKERNDELSRRSMEAKAGAASVVARTEAAPQVDSAYPPEPVADGGPVGVASPSDPEELERLRRSLRHAENDATSERESRMVLESRVAELQEVRAMLEAALEKAGSDAEAARSNLEESAATYREEAEAARQELQQVAQANLSDAEAARDQLEQNIRQLVAADEALAVAKRETQAARGQAAAAESAAAATTSEMAARVEELETELDAARTEQEALAARLEGQEQRATRAEGEVVMWAQRVKDLEERPDLTEELEAARVDEEARVLQLKNL
ncbi:MAG TPA: hypothetical protein VJ913_08055, partial [Actinomycetota bacterium]|nr:hypothetical protein [Actinomycetota bacterium]